MVDKYEYKTFDQIAATTKPSQTMSQMDRIKSFGIESLSIRVEVRMFQFDDRYRLNRFWQKPILEVFKKRTAMSWHFERMNKSSATKQNRKKTNLSNPTMWITSNVDYVELPDEIIDMRWKLKFRWLAAGFNSPLKFSNLHMG